MSRETFPSTLSVDSPETGDDIWFDQINNFYDELLKDEPVTLRHRTYSKYMPAISANGSGIKQLVKLYEELTERNQTTPIYDTESGSRYYFKLTESVYRKTSRPHPEYNQQERIIWLKKLPPGRPTMKDQPIETWIYQPDQAPQYKLYHSSDHNTDTAPDSSPQAFLEALAEFQSQLQTTPPLVNL